MEKLRAAAATSEFWVAILSSVGIALVQLGVVDQESFDKVLWPAMTYIVARVTGKAAKASIPTK